MGSLVEAAPIYAPTWMTRGRVNGGRRAKLVRPAEGLLAEQPHSAQLMARGTDEINTAILRCRRAGASREIRRVRGVQKLWAFVTRVG